MGCVGIYAGIYNISKKVFMDITNVYCFMEINMLYDVL